jgi:hypothetical protein
MTLLFTVGALLLLWGLVYLGLRVGTGETIKRFEPVLPNPKGARKLRKSRAKASKKRKSL